MWLWKKRNKSISTRADDVITIRWNDSEKIVINSCQKRLHSTIFENKAVPEEMRNLGLVQQALSMKRCYNTNAKKNCIHKIVKQLPPGKISFLKPGHVVLTKSHDLYQQELLSSITRWHHSRHGWQAQMTSQTQGQKILKKKNSTTQYQELFWSPNLDSRLSMRHWNL